MEGPTHAGQYNKVGWGYPLQYVMQYFSWKLQNRCRNVWSVHYVNNLVVWLRCL